MSDKYHENVSALVDDELTGEQLRQTLKELGHSPELRRQWSRHNLISDALHGNLSAADSSTLQARVWQALEQEPTVLAPPRQKKLPPLLKQAVGVAIAASVAAVAIFAVKDTPVPGAGGIITPQIAQTAPGDNALVQLASTGGGAGAPTEDLRGRLNPYLVNHNEYSVSAGMHGVLPYARLVGHESTR